jgi:hypothetical protein
VGGEHVPEVAMAVHAAALDPVHTTLRALSDEAEEAEEEGGMRTLTMVAGVESTLCFTLYDRFRNVRLQGGDLVGETELALTVAPPPTAATGARRPTVRDPTGWGDAAPYSDAKVANRNTGFGTARQKKWPSNDGRIPNVRGVRVHVSTRYNREEGKSAGVAKRPRERSPARNPLTRNVAIRSFSIAV